MTAYYGVIPKYLKWTMALGKRIYHEHSPVETISKTEEISPVLNNNSSDTTTESNTKDNVPDATTAKEGNNARITWNSVHMHKFSAP